MAKTTACRRKTRRHRISPGSDARVEFQYPDSSGSSFALTDISVSGFSFSVPEDGHGLETGAALPGAVVRIGECEIRGELLIMHATAESGTVGALFYPASDEELVKLKSVIAGIEAVVG